MFTYSIIIPTYNRAEEIKECLHSLSQLKFDTNRVEVIVVDDGSVDHTEKVISEFSGNFPFSLYYFKQKNQGPSAARNLGIQKAKGDYVIFLDSDVVVPENYLSKIDEALQHDPVEAFGGPDKAHKDFPPLLKAIDYAMTGFLTTGGLRGKKGKKLAKYYPRTFSMGVKRDFALKIGGFSPLRFGEDIEFSHRIYKNAGRIIYIDNPVFHKRRTSLKSFFKQVFNSGVARINLFKIDSSLLEPLHALPAVATLFSLAIVLLHLFLPSLHSITSLILWGIIGYFFLVALSGAIKYHSLKVGMYLLVVAPIQIFGYGMGFIFNAIRRLLFKKEETAGIVKRYYG